MATSMRPYDYPALTRNHATRVRVQREDDDDRSAVAAEAVTDERAPAPGLAIHVLVLLAGDRLASAGRIFRREQRTLIPTDLPSEVPYMRDIVPQLDAQHTRVRVMTITQGNRLAWRSHVQQVGQYPSCMTVHIPVVVPE